ncbi:MAG TPA: DUF262 domain-containing protein [Pyrinomonadaceae bacterium]|nr:DUF262 domain-containing protein [Pyrinomonadaceae bacterium]
MKAKRRVEEWLVEDLVKNQTQITFPDFQRERKLWSAPQKALLIDSILKDIDIPKLYFNKNDKAEFEVVDGQQRLWAIWDYFNDEYSCEVNGEELYFSDLEKPPKDRIKNTIKNYKLQITVFEQADEDYLRQLFVRLQWGLLLNTGEKLNAASGEMKEFVFHQLAKRNFIQELGLPKTRARYARETLCAQICINSFSREQLNGRFARTRYDDLLHFFQEFEHPKGKDRTFFERQTTKITRIVDQLWQAFGSDATTLSNRSYLLSVYILFEELGGKDGKISAKQKEEFAEFVLTLWKLLKEESAKGFNRTDEELYKFQTYLSSAPGERYQIEKRYNQLKEYYSHFKKTGKIKGH